MKVCAFTGHRPQKLSFGYNENDPRCDKLKALLAKEIERLYLEEGVRHFISGMALGVDTYAAEAVLALRERYPDVTLEAAIPCESQAIKWREEARDRYFDIIERCDKETMVSRRYTPDCMEKRNRYMVDQADFLIAIWDGTPSGTGNTVRYAYDLGKKIITIVPKSFS